MSESSQEKTEQPSARRLKKSREQGQVPRSRELTSALLLLSSSLILSFAAEPAGNSFRNIFVYNLSVTRDALFDPQTMSAHLLASGKAIVPLAGLILMGMMLAGIVGQTLVGGWVFNFDSLAPKGSRMNPAQWPKKVFSKRGAVELVKSILKVMLVVGCLIWLLWNNYPQLLNLGRMPLNLAITFGLETLATALFSFAMTLVLISALDAPFQVWDNLQKLKMTRQELKDEQKDIEGRPEVKQKIRQLQRQMANSRMMQRVPEADVVIVNPSHYSVALKYDQERASAPYVLAKGTDHLALKIREVAGHNHIDVIDSPMLTRAIYYSTDIDQEIPADLYLAVAQVLAHIHQLREFRQGVVSRAPVFPDLEIPDSYQESDRIRSGKQ